MIYLHLFAYINIYKYIYICIHTVSQLRICTSWMNLHKRLRLRINPGKQHWYRPSNSNWRTRRPSRFHRPLTSRIYIDCREKGFLRRLFKCQRYPWLIIYYVYLLTKQNRKKWWLLNGAKNVVLHPIPNIVKTFQPFVCVFHASPLMPNWTSWSFQPTWHRPQATADPLPRKGRRAPCALQRHRFGNSSRPVGLGEKQLRHGAQGLKISEVIGKS